MSQLVRNLKRVIKVQPTMTADDNADNDVAFDWTAISDFSTEKGLASTLQSVAILDLVMPYAVIKSPSDKVICMLPHICTAWASAAVISIAALPAPEPSIKP